MARLMLAACLVGLMGLTTATFTIELTRKMSWTEKLLSYRFTLAPSDHENRKFVDSMLRQTGQSLNHYYDLEYWAQLAIGTQPQTFNVVLSTASSDIFVLSQKCSERSCQSHHLYNSGVSKTYVENATQFYFQIGNDTKDAIKGFFSTDTVSFGGLSVKQQTFVEITQMSPIVLKLLQNVDAVLGLAWPELSESGCTKFYENVYDSNQVPAPVFSIYINPDKSSPYGGAIVMGGVDDQFYSGPITNVSIYDSPFWSFPIDSISAGGETICSKCPAVIVIEEPLILGPPGKIKAINAMIGATQSELGFYYCDCSVMKAATVTFTIGGTSFALHGSIFAFSIPNQRICVSPFYASPSYIPDAGEIWVLGTKFLAQVYTVYNFGSEQIGFASPISLKKRVVKTDVAADEKSMIQALLGKLKESEKEISAKLEKLENDEKAAEAREAKVVEVLKKNEKKAENKELEPDEDFDKELAELEKIQAVAESKLTKTKTKTVTEKNVRKALAALGKNPVVRKTKADATKEKKELEDVDKVLRDLFE